MLPNKKGSRIIEYIDGDFQNEEEWPRLFEWLKERAESFYTTFSYRIRSLDLDDEAA